MISNNDSDSQQGASEERIQHIVLKFETMPDVPLNVPASQEALYREAAIFIQDRYRFYQRIKPSASIAEIWQFVALETAVSLYGDMRKKKINEVDKRAATLNKLINNVLSKTND